MKTLFIFLAVLAGAVAQTQDSYVVVMTNSATGQGATVVPLKSIGSVMGKAACPATTGAMTVNMDTAIKTITPTGNCTFNATGGTEGQTVTFFVTTSGTSSWTLTFGTNFFKTGTLATGTTTARRFTVTFRCDGTAWWEIARTAAQT